MSSELFKMLFLLTIMMGTLISISSYSWFAMWIGLELNLLSFIPLMNEGMSKTSEATIKYFIIQALSSAFILFSILSKDMLSEYFMIMESPYSLIMSTALLTKMGAAPFHFWFPEISEGLSWSNNLILLTWQKIAPMILLMYNFMTMYFFSLVICMTMLISGVMNWNQTNLKKFLAYSSMNHMGWMLSVLFFNQSCWMMYFIVYFAITLSLVSMFKIFQINSINSLFSMMNSNKSIKLFFFLNFMSLGGLPPFLGFLPKWLILKILLENKLFFLSVVMIFLTLVMLYSYIRLIFNPLVLKISEFNKLSTIPFSYISMAMNYLNITGIFLFSIILNY